MCVELQSSAGETELEEMVSLEEERHHSPASSSAVHTAKPSSSETPRDSLGQDADEEDVIQDLGQSERQDVAVSVHVSPTADFSAAAQEEEDQEQQQQEENGEELEEDAQSEGLTLPIMNLYMYLFLLTYNTYIYYCRALDANSRFY